MKQMFFTDFSLNRTFGQSSGVSTIQFFGDHTDIFMKFSPLTDFVRQDAVLSKIHTTVTTINKKL